MWGTTKVWVALYAVMDDAGPCIRVRSLHQERSEDTRALHWNLRTLISFVLPFTS